jgi:hypothetical protein
MAAGSSVKYEVPAPAAGATEEAPQPSKAASNKAKMIRIQTFVVKQESRLPYGYIACFIAYAAAFINGMFASDAVYLYRVSSAKREDAAAHFLHWLGPDDVYGGFVEIRYGVFHQLSVHGGGADVCARLLVRRAGCRSIRSSGGGGELSIGRMHASLRVDTRAATEAPGMFWFCFHHVKWKTQPE